VLIQNLSDALTETDITDIFQEVGEILDCVVHRTSNDKTEGSAMLTFRTHSEALKAVAEFDKAKVDERPMFVRIAQHKGDKAFSAPAPQAARPIPARVPTTREQPQKRTQNQKQPSGGRGVGRGAQRGGGHGARGGRGAARGGHGGKAKKVLTTAELDADLDNYKTSKPAAI